MRTAAMRMRLRDRSRIDVSAGQVRHRPRLLTADHHVDDACCSAWKLPIGAELRASWVFDAVAGVFDRAHRLGADQRSGEVDDLLDQRQRLVLGADQRVDADPHAIERDVRGAHLVERAIRRDADAGRADGDDERGEAVAIAVRARRAGSDQQRVGACACSTTDLRRR